MIGGGLKKLAKENGMTVSNGVAYGSLRGYAATLSEGAGYKQIVFSSAFSDPVKKTEFLTAVGANGDKWLYKNYRVNRLGVSGGCVQITFHDTVGTMKKIRDFLDWFIPLLQQYEATTANICPECGFEVAEDSWIMVDGICHHVHTVCGEKIARQIEADNQQEKEARTGSYLTGAIGAFLGAALGAVLWAVVLYIGYIASLVGLIIGFLAEKGYDLLKGKQGKGKIVILILAILFGVLAGTFATDAVTLAGMIRGGELPGILMGDIPAFILFMLADSPEYLRATLGNVGLGLLFAALGVFSMLRRAGKEVAGTRFVKLR